MQRRRSHRTTAAGLLGGLALVTLGVSKAIQGESLSIEEVLLILGGVGVAGMGATARDDAVTSEGTKSRLRRRDP